MDTAPFLKSVNSQITDGVTQASLAVLGLAPAVATSNALQMFSHASGLSAQNAVAGQQQMSIVSQAGIARFFASQAPQKTCRGRNSNMLHDLEIVALVLTLLKDQQKSSGY